MWVKLLDLLLIVVPVIVEWFKKRRDEDESAAGFVRKQQAEKLKTYDAMESGGNEITALAQTRNAVVADLLRRVQPLRDERAGAAGVSTEGTQLPDNGKKQD